MNKEKLLEHFLKWVDENTTWKEDNDIPNHIIVTEYLKENPLTEETICPICMCRHRNPDHDNSY